jgi:hypothetical protein
MILSEQNLRLTQSALLLHAARVKKLRPKKKPQPD